MHNNTTANPRRLRTRSGLSLDEAGRRARVERSRLSRWERGYLRLRRDELLRLARALHVRSGVLPELVPFGANERKEEDK